MTRVWPGEPAPFGATPDHVGTNFSIYSENATRVELCMFDQGNETRLDLTERTAHRWHGFVPGVGPGLRYGYRVHGPEGPGHAFDPAKLLLDPYARAIEGEVEWGEAMVTPGIDDAGFMPKAVVCASSFDWGGDAHPRTGWHETLIYEVHVRNITYRHQDIPESIRGTYAGLAHPAIVSHLKNLGVTAVELLPVHQHIHDHRLVSNGLRNHWGYQTIGFFAPHDGYASVRGGSQIDEFKQMVKVLHAEGIEVILDVVYNHTGEGGESSPPIFLRGIDNLSYYRTSPEDPSIYIDYTGTGNSLNMRNPYVLQLIMDSLRYWVEEMHVDGFRFDLASTLARELHDVDRLSSFFDVVQQDPVIGRVKLIAEPWDLGEGGYQVGNFPPLWSEWNGMYRDTMRDYWRGHEHGLAEFAYRLTGSSDLYQDDGRHPSASINFITAHDGFTLHDLVTYERKHNDANLENSMDGTDDNRSWNCGVEGETDDPSINLMRDRQKRNMLMTLLLSQGVPMLLGGDELGRTQRGNNNAYCQDNEISWFDWDLRPEQEELRDFVSALSRVRRSNPVLRRRRFFQGSDIQGSMTEIAWLTPDGSPMTDENWGHGFSKSLQVFLNGEEIPEVDARGERVRGDSLLLVFNAHDEALSFTAPSETFGRSWEPVISSDPGVRGIRPAAGETFQVIGRSVTVLRRVD